MSGEPTFRCDIDHPETRGCLDPTHYQAGLPTEAIVLLHAPLSATAVREQRRESIRRHLRYLVNDASALNAAAQGAAQNFNGDESVPREADVSVVILREIQTSIGDHIGELERRIREEIRLSPKKPAPPGSGAGLGVG